MKVDAGRMRMMDDRRGKDGKLAGMDMVGKFDDRVVCLSLSEMSKDSL